LLASSAADMEPEGPAPMMSTSVMERSLFS
jgi:hypothetical protein